jgi:serine/threonine protein kinase
MNEKVELRSGQTIASYEILSFLSRGGMGEVYLAKDTKLDRKVALKILPAEVAANRERMQRFVQEAKSASALNHPNIITRLPSVLTTSAPTRAMPTSCAAWDFSREKDGPYKLYFGAKTGGVA